MTVHYSKNGNIVHMIQNHPGLLDELPPYIYVLLYDDDKKFYYLEERSEKFDLPEKIYTDKRRENKIINFFLHEDRKSVGVLTTGNKGTGKTLLNKTVCNSMIEKGYPVILIEHAHYGEEFTAFIQKINKCVLFFDEFGKIYNNTDSYNQEYLLGLLDGASATDEHILFLFSDNTTNNINDYLLDRPGRIRYWFKYDKLEIEILKDYCKDKNINSDIVTNIISVYNRKQNFSFDMLKAIVDEYLLFNERISDIIKDLNIIIYDNHDHQVKVISVINNKNNEECIDKIDKNKLLIPNPLFKSARIRIVLNDDDESYYTLMLDFDDLILTNETHTKLTFKSNGYIIKCEVIATSCVV